MLRKVRSVSVICIGTRGFAFYIKYSTGGGAGTRVSRWRTREKFHFVRSFFPPVACMLKTLSQRSHPGDHRRGGGGEKGIPPGLYFMA